MSMQDLNEAFQHIEKYSLDKSFNGKKSLQLIEKAESFLNLKFPPTYKIFIEEYGCNGPGYIEIYGILDDDFINSETPDAIWLTQKRRKTGAPSDIIFIASTGYGPYYVLDCSRPDECGEYPVLIWASDDFDRHKMEVANKDFGSFLLQELKSLEDINSSFEEN